MIGTFELFKIGIGPSSSHTVGPMKAAAAFAGAIVASGVLPRVDRVRVDLFGSLAWTGKGHRTDKAVMLGLSGLSPESIDPDAADRRVDDIATTRQLVLADGTAIDRYLLRASEIVRNEARHVARGPGADRSGNSGCSGLRQSIDEATQAYGFRLCARRRRADLCCCGGQDGVLG